MLSLTEENYLKTIYHLSEDGLREVSTSEIATAVQTKAASVTDMIQKLSAKNLVSYEKYHGVKITSSGASAALTVVRKHRLWETFLVNKLGLAWSEVHDIAEQLEHIQSPLLIEKLDAFLGHPSHDPHGHPIPDEEGYLQPSMDKRLSEAFAGAKGTVTSVNDNSPSFLEYLDRIGIHPGTRIIVKDKMLVDGSVEVLVDGKTSTHLSREASENIQITSYE